MIPAFRSPFRRRILMRLGWRKPESWGALATTLLLAAIFVSGSVLLGASRLWIELPLLGVVSLLIALQGVRLIRKKPSETMPGRIDIIDWAVLLFVVYALVRWLTSPTEYFSRLEVMSVLAYAGVFFTCRHGVTHRQHGIFLLYVLVGLGLGETLFGYYLSLHLNWLPYGTYQMLHEYYAPRWVGTYGNPNHFASMLVMAIGGALALACFSKLPWPVRIILFYLALIMMVGVMCSGSKGSWIALMGSIAALTVAGIRNGTLRWWGPVLGALALVVVAVFLFNTSYVVRDRLAEVRNLVHEGRVGTYLRFQLTRDALHIARDHPLFGTGPGTFAFVHPRYQDPTFKFKAVLTHDDYLNCLDDYGVVGFGLALLFVGAVTLKFFRPLVLDQRWQDRVLVATGFAAWVALVVHSVLDFNLHIPANAILLFGLTGLALSRIRQEEEIVRHWSTFSLNRLGAWPGYAIFVGALIYGSAWLLPTAISNSIYEHTLARLQKSPTSDSIVRLQDALKYDAGNAQAWLLLGDLHRYQAARRLGPNDPLAEGQLALDSYQHALHANPLNTTLDARMGMTYDVMHRYSEAFFFYREAVLAEPFNGQFWFNLGNHFWERGMLMRAEMAYLRSENCPDGQEGSDEAVKRLRALPEMANVPLPLPNADPLAMGPLGDKAESIR